MVARRFDMMGAPTLQILAGTAAIAMAGLACRVATLPPASSRSDGGPVSARGVVSHEARSQVRLYRDAAGCESVQTLNRQFRVVTITDRDSVRRIVLEEASDVRHCLDQDLVSAEATVTAWAPAVDAATPLYRIRGRGLGGEPVGNLYRMATRACCGSRDLAAFYSLLTGRALFRSSGPVLGLEDAASRSTTYVAFHDTYSATLPPEAAADSNVAGVLQLANEREPGPRLVVTSRSSQPYELVGMAFVVNGRLVADTVIQVGARRATPLAVRVDLAGAMDSSRASVEVPIRGRHLLADSARTTGGLSIRR